MKYAIYLSLLSLVASTASVIPSSLLASAQSNQPQTNKSTNGHSLIDPALKKFLKSTGIKIAIPQYVPKGFRVATIKTEPCPDNVPVDAKGVCRFRPSYAVLYRNAQNHCFAVSAIGGGIGGPDGRYNRRVSTKILGMVDINVGTATDAPSEPMTEAIANTPQKHLWVFPAGNSPYYQVATISGKNNWISSSFPCTTKAYMTPKEFTKIVQSLEWLP